MFINLNVDYLFIGNQKCESLWFTVKDLRILSEVNQ